jgi:hypothetical protein
MCCPGGQRIADMGLVVGDALAKGGSTSYVDRPAI